MTKRCDISIIVPVLNEAELLPVLGEQLSELRNLPGVSVIVVDGGSDDDTAARLREAGLHVIEGPRGRARQMNAGAAASETDVLVFLHADTRLPATAIAELRAAAATEAAWGRFDVRIDGRSAWLGVVSRMMNLRSRLSGIATGDQAIFVRKDLFTSIGGFSDQPLMEDIEISKTLKNVARPRCLSSTVVTSGRRWDQNGVWPTILLMWRLRFAYWRGASAAQLASQYA